MIARPQWLGVNEAPQYPGSPAANKSSLLAPIFPPAPFPPFRCFAGGTGLTVFNNGPIVSVRQESPRYPGNRFLAFAEFQGSGEVGEGGLGCKGEKNGV